MCSKNRLLNLVAVFCFYLMHQFINTSGSCPGSPGQPGARGARPGVLRFVDDVDLDDLAGRDLERVPGGHVVDRDERGHDQVRALDELVDRLDLLHELLCPPESQLPGFLASFQVNVYLEDLLGVRH